MGNLDSVPWPQPDATSRYLAGGGEDKEYNDNCPLKLPKIGEADDIKKRVNDLHWHIDHGMTEQ